MHNGIQNTWELDSWNYVKKEVPIFIKTLTFTIMDFLIDDGQLKFIVDCFKWAFIYYTCYFMGIHKFYGGLVTVSFKWEWILETKFLIFRYYTSRFKKTPR